MLEKCEKDRAQEEEKNTLLHTKLEFYEKLTGLQVESIYTDMQVVDQTLAEDLQVIEEPVSNYVCKQQGARGGNLQHDDFVTYKNILIYIYSYHSMFLEIEYTLCVPHDTPFVTYVPKDEANVASLGMPEHFVEEMQFASDMTDKFFWKLTDALQKPDQTIKAERGAEDDTQTIMT